MFIRWWEIPRGSVQVLQIYTSLGGWLVLLVTSHLWMAGPSGPVFVRFQDLKFVVFSIMDFDSQGLDVVFSWIHPPWKLTWQWKITFFKWLGFSRCHLGFRFFSFDLLRLSFLRLFGSNPSSPERKSADQIALAKIQDDIMCHLNRRMREPFEWILNILTLILQDTPGGNTVTCTSVIQTLKTHIFTDSCLWIWTPRHKALMIKRIIKQFVWWPDRDH